MAEQMAPTTREPQSHLKTTAKVIGWGSVLEVLGNAIAPSLPELLRPLADFLPFIALGFLNGIGSFARSMAHEYMQPTEKHPNGRSVPWWVRGMGLG